MRVCAVLAVALLSLSAAAEKNLFICQGEARAVDRYMQTKAIRLQEGMLPIMKYTTPNGKKTFTGQGGLFMLQFEKEATKQDIKRLFEKHRLVVVDNLAPYQNCAVFQAISAVVAVKSDFFRLAGSEIGVNTLAQFVQPDWLKAIQAESIVNSAFVDTNMVENLEPWPSR